MRVRLQSGAGDKTEGKVRGRQRSFLVSLSVSVLRIPLERGPVNWGAVGLEVISWEKCSVVSGHSSGLFSARVEEARSAGDRASETARSWTGYAGVGHLDARVDHFKSVPYDSSAPRFPSLQHRVAAWGELQSSPLCEA